MFPWRERRGQAVREMAKLKKKGHAVSPVVVEGRTIVKTFWGKAWCQTSNVIATMPTGCRAAALMSVMAP